MVDISKTCRVPASSVSPTGPRKEGRKRGQSHRLEWLFPFFCLRVSRDGSHIPETSSHKDRALAGPALTRGRHPHSLTRCDASRGGIPETGSQAAEALRERAPADYGRLPLKTRPRPPTVVNLRRTMPSLNAHKMTTAARISLAKAKTERVVDHLRALILMHEANAIVVYSPALAGQVPHSFAAIAFNQFQRSMHWLEIIRVCALWDSDDLDKENIPTIVKLIDDGSVEKALVDETRARWKNQPLPRDLAPSDDAEVRRAVDEALAQSHSTWAEQQAASCRDTIEATISRAKSVMSSPRQIAVMNIRHKHLAHSLGETESERKGLARPMKWGDEKWLLEETIAVVDGLHLAINSSSFAWDQAREHAKRYAHALWDGCRFDIST